MKICFILVWGLSLGCAPKKSYRLTESTPSAESPQFYASSIERQERIYPFYQQLFGTPFITLKSDTDRLLSGTVNSTRVPYSGSWYPEANGGTNHFGALEKYDAAFHDGTPNAVQWENRHHGSSIKWYGHCNGFSVASSRHQDPGTAVGRPRGCLTDPATPCKSVFQPRDIRALLAEVYMSTENNVSLGGIRCETPKDQLPKDPATRSAKTSMTPCEDINPADFHLGLINWVGMQGQVVIFDQYIGDEVWNFPIYKYQIEYQQDGQLLNEKEAMAKLGVTADHYSYNEEIAASFLEVKTTITHAKALKLGETSEGSSNTVPYARTYHYLLELDSDERIIGGEWLGTSKTEHPDFLWFPFEPSSRYLENRKFGNFYVDPKEVMSLWAESVGFDPDKQVWEQPLNPNKIYRSPKEMRDWGKNAYFLAELAGGGTGAAFSGFPIPVSIVATAKELEGSNLRVLVDGEEIFQGVVTLNKAQTAQFESQPGMHAMSFEWIKDDVTLPASVAYRFYVL